MHQCDTAAAEAFIPVKLKALASHGHKPNYGMRKRSKSNQSTQHLQVKIVMQVQAHSTSWGL